MKTPASSLKIAIWILAILVLIEGVFIVILLKPRKISPLLPTPKGKIAIVLDDWGYNLNNLHILDEIKLPLNCALLPNLPYSRQIAQELHQRGCEIILHLPLEPYEEYRLEKDTIQLSMDKETIKNIIEQDLYSIVYAQGVSNHMGSAATSDLRVMEIIFAELKKRHLYFLDNLVSSKSLCFELAKKVNLKFARRDIFLDNTPKPEYIKKQLEKLKQKAQRKGYALGIGHDRKLTLETLREMLPLIQKEGYQFVFVSEVVE